MICILSLKNLKKEVTYLIRTSKKEYYKQYFAKNKDNIKKIWKGIKDKKF